MEPTQQKQTGWKPGKRDAIFLAIVAAVVLVLVLGTGERTTKPTPKDETHLSATSRAECLNCHSSTGVKPQPLGHTAADQCFQCHLQPEGWRGGK